MSDAQNLLPTRRVSLRLGEASFASFMQVEIVRDLAELAGSFSLRCYEPKRSRDFLGGVAAIADAAGAAPGQSATLSLDGETVMVGWVDRIRLGTRGEDLSCEVHGRDKAGDLVDCAALPGGPAELIGLRLRAIVERIAAPFGLKVRSDVEDGAPFARFGIDPGETAAEAIAKACRQRAVLCVSDGVGGLVLTRGGKQRGAGALRLGEGILESDVTLDWEQRFSEVIVKGQTEKAAGNRQATARLDTSVPPITIDPPAPPAASAPGRRERAGVLMTGRARDEEITRYRPRVVMAGAQSGGASVQEQADWAVRVQRGKSTLFEYTVPDWRTGTTRVLWRPNELVPVDDRFAGVFAEMLVVGVTYLYDEQGARTRLRIAGRSAFDLVAEGEERGSVRQRLPAPGRDAVASPLTVPQPPPIRR